MRTIRVEDVASAAWAEVIVCGDVCSPVTLSVMPATAIPCGGALETSEIAQV